MSDFLKGYSISGPFEKNDEIMFFTCGRPEFATVKDASWDILTLDLGDGRVLDASREFISGALRRPRVWEGV